MFKKLSRLLAGLVATVLAFGSVTAAWAAAPRATGAAGENPPVLDESASGVIWGGGEVTAIGENSFTVVARRARPSADKPAAAERIIQVTSATQFTNRDAETITFAALQVGDRVFGATRKAADGTLTALIVHVFPAPTTYKGLGRVESVDAGEGSFVFLARRGQKTWEFYVDAQTQYTDRNGGTHSFAEIAAGSRLAVKAEKRADGKWWAVTVGFPLKDQAPQP